MVRLKQNKKDCKINIYGRIITFINVFIFQYQRNLLLLRNGKQVSDLRVDIRYLPISKPTKRDDGTIEPAVESSM